MLNKYFSDLINNHITKNFIPLNEYDKFIMS